MQQMRIARPGLAGDGRANGSQGAANTLHHFIPFRPVALQMTKRGRVCTIAKLVEATPMNQIVLAMPYRHRQTVNHVSVPPVVLRYARESGARLWLVRLDSEGLCYALPLADVERAGWLKPSEGKPEWFVPLSRFTPMAWQGWEYVTQVVQLDAMPTAGGPAQLALSW